MSTTYETDFHGWAMQQAEAVRSGAPLDVGNVAEELEALGRNVRTHLVNNLAVLIAHRLKWDHQPGRRSRSRTLTIAEHRDRIQDHLADNPSLESLIPELTARAYRYARMQAARDTGLALKTFPERCPYTWDGLMTALPGEEE